MGIQESYNRVAGEIQSQKDLISQIRGVLANKAASGGGLELPKLDNPGSASHAVEDMEFYDMYGVKVTGNIPIRSENDLTTTSTSVTVPAGFYEQAITKSVDEGNGTVEGDSLSKLYYWEKSATTETITEETVNNYRLYYKSNYGTQSVSYGFSQYAAEIDIVDGALTLVNPQSRDGVANSDYDTVLPGKYIQSYDTLYRIPADVVITHSSTTGYTQYNADRVFKMTLVSAGATSIVVSDDSSMFPTNGEQDGYTYVYKGTLNTSGSSSSEAVIRALNVTTNGTYTAPSGVDGYSPVTVNVASGGVELPDIDDSVLGSALDLVEGKKLIAPDGTVVTGEIPKRTSSDLTASGITVTAPAGYYASEAEKTVTVPTETKTVTSNGTYTPSSGKYFSSVTVNVGTSSGYKSGDIVKAFPASATLASGYNVSSVSASDSVKKDENGVVSLSGVTSTVAIGSIDNVKGCYVKASSGSIYYVPADATITQGGSTYNETYTVDKANLMFVLA